MFSEDELLPFSALADIVFCEMLAALAVHAQDGGWRKIGGGLAGGAVEIMKKYLNTLFVTTQGAYLNKEGESVIASAEREVKLRVPIHTLGGIVCFGNVLCSPFLMHHCAENNVLISFLSEQGRSFFADRLALSLVNLKQVQGNGFKKTESGAVEMTDDTRKTVLVAYQKRKTEEMIHPFVEESAALGIFFHLQAQMLARHLRGDLDGYPPVIWK